jgi:hypothetical protein
VNLLIDHKGSDLADDSEKVRRDFSLSQCMIIIICETSRDCIRDWILTKGLWDD